MSRKDKQRGGKHGLTPKGGTFYPKALELSFSDDDPKYSRLLPDSHLATVYDRLLQRDFTKLATNPPITGKYLDCFQTVERAHRTYGGVIHTGWLFDKCLLKTGNNRLGGTQLMAHAVWEFDGKMYETIPAYNKGNFILDDAVPFGSQMTIGFLDRVQLIAYPFKPKNLRFKLIDLKKQVRKSAVPSDHVEFVSNMARRFGWHEKSRAELDAEHDNYMRMIEMMSAKIKNPF